jgi:integrase
MAVSNKNGYWYCVYRDGAGKLQYEYFGKGKEAKKEADARDLEVKLAKTRTRGRSLGDHGLTFEALCRAYITARQVEISEKTEVEILRTLANYILPAIAKKSVSRLSMADWLDIQEAMIANGLSAKSINTYFRYTNKILRWAVTHGMMKDNPWKNREALRQKKRSIELITLEEFTRILQHAPDHLFWALEVAYFTGVRPGQSELFALKWSDVDFTNSRIRIFATKTQTYRWQYVDPRFTDRMIGRMLYGGGSDFIVSYRGQPVQTLKTAFNRAKARAGITKPIRLYDIRHFYITHAMANGADILDLAERVGHVDATMIVKVYAHMVEEMRRKEALKIPRIEFGKLEMLGKTVGETEEKGLTISR